VKSQSGIQAGFFLWFRFGKNEIEMSFYYFVIYITKMLIG